MSADLGARNEAEPLSLYRLCLFQIGFSCCMKHHLLISAVMGYCHHSLILSLLSKGIGRTIHSCKGRESWYVDTAFLFKEPIGAIFKFYPLLTYTRKWFGWWKGLHVRPLIDIRIRWRSCLFVVSPFPLHRAGFSSHQFLITEVSHSRSFLNSGLLLLRWLKKNIRAWRSRCRRFVMLNSRSLDFISRS